MARHGIVTIIIRNSETKEIIQPALHHDVFAAAEAREELEKKYPFPDFDILEIISEQKEFIHGDLLSGGFHERSKEAMDKGVQEFISETERDSKPQLLVKELKECLDSGKLDRAREICRVLGNDFISETGMHFMLGIAYMKLGDLPVAANHFLKSWEDKKLDSRKRTISLWNAGYVFWQDGQFEEAVRQTENALQEAKKLGEQDLIKALRNNRNYFLAEVGRDLELALRDTLDLLEIPPEEDYLGVIESRTFTGEKDGLYLDTLGRILESMGEEMIAFRVLLKTKDVMADDPISKNNLLRVYKKLEARLT